jgi:hypothetical protein
VRVRGRSGFCVLASGFCSFDIVKEVDGLRAVATLGALSGTQVRFGADGGRSTVRCS